MRMFNASQDEKVKAHIVAIEKSALGGTPESNEHLRVLLIRLQKAIPGGAKSQAFLQCQQAVSLTLKSRFAKADEKAELQTQAKVSFDLAINSIITELKKESIPQPVELTLKNLR